MCGGKLYYDHSLFHMHILDFEGVSRLLTFDTEHSRGVVHIAILDDVEREVALETVNLQLSLAEEEKKQ